MKQLILLALLFSFSHVIGQTPVKNYDQEWKQVDDFTKKRLPKSALAEVKKIYALAKKDKQDAQIIKSLVFMTSLQNENREGNKDSAILEIEKEIPLTQEPATSILKSLLADRYLSYYNSIRWQLYNRTQTVNVKKGDISTWSTEDFHKKIADLYLRSIHDEKLLQQTRLEPYDAIIAKGNMRHLRPTLYDLLAHRALDYFKNDERELKKPAYAFEIDQASAFDPAVDFVGRKFITNDSLSLQHKALLIFQKLISFHLMDPRPDALIDVDLLRIQFVKDNSVHPDKDKLYFNAINHVAHEYENLPAAAQAWYLLAAYYEQQAQDYKPYADTTHRYDNIKAKEICEKVLAQKDSSEGKTNCYNLLNQMSTVSLQFSVEKVNVPDQPFRVMVNYRNFSKLYLRIIKADDKLKNDMETQPEDKYWKSIIAAKPMKAWEQSLPETNDMQEHLAEIKVDGLPTGEYLLVSASDNDFADSKTLLGARLFFVSSISFVNNDKDFFVLDRDSGQPLAGASAWIWENVYDYKTSTYTKKRIKQYKTDTHGFFRWDKSAGDDNNNDIYLDITYNNDHLFLDDELEQYHSYGPESPSLLKGEREIDARTFTYLFTDRSIYRPGQTVFFKGISILTDKEGNRSIRDSYATRLYLVNANDQRVDSMNVSTNDFGTFSGKFQLPAGILNGQFRIEMKMNRGSQYISVEEYKRPKFYVDYDPVKGTYKVNDTIKVTGIAKAYAGNNVDDASVRYRVVRQPRFLYSWIYWRWWQPPTQQMEIAHGEVMTDENGKFNIKFSAIPDLKVNKELDPVFDYTVYADITDINGETRSGEMVVSVSYKALLLKIDIPDALSIDSLNNLSIRTENMNGEFEPATVNVTMTRLKEEQRLIRDRYWARPDQFVMSKEEYIRNFPHDEYDNETQLQTWPKGERVLERTDSSRASGEWRVASRDSSKASGEWGVAGGKYLPGAYVIEISTTDKNGDVVKDVRYISLYDDKSNKLNYPAYLSASDPRAIEPGEQTSIRVGSSAEDVFLIQQRSQQGLRSREFRTKTYSFLRISNEKKGFDFSATEADRGGYGVSFLFVKHNRFYHSNQTIFVPWTNKDLTIEYATFRDKTLPGSEEKWKVKLKGYKNEKVAAEMLASMYDASLDQFDFHSWSMPGVWPFYTHTTPWTSDPNFSLIESDQKAIVNVGSKYLYKEYDNVNGTGKGIIRGGSRKNVGVYFSTPTVTYEFAEANASDYAVLGAPVKKMNVPKAVLKSNGYAMTIAVPDSNGDGRIDQFDLTPSSNKNLDNIQIRKNFNETAFFFPDLRTDSTGAIEFSFAMPEALTKWKFQALAHTKELAFGYSTKEIVTQKQLMVQPNTPRFLREGDKMEFSAKVVNLTNKELTGQAEFQLFDATTNQSVDGGFKNSIPNQYFTVAAGQSEAVKFPIEVPYQFNKALTWRITAKAVLDSSNGGEVSDGEEDALPVLTNRMLVTETMPLNMRGAGTKNFKFEKLLNSENSETLQNHSLTVEYTSNPAWYAIQSLPYLMEFPYECAEQTWNRYFANSLATMIANSSPRIQQVFEQWRTKDTSALLSNLQKNEELKSVLLEETPWVLQAKSEAEQKKNIALLFDMVKMSRELNGSFEKLKQMQSPNGGFVWFKGGPDDRYITQYIVTGIGHLKKLNAIAGGQDHNLKPMLNSAIAYLDKKLSEDYTELAKHSFDLKKYVPGSSIIQYLYMRSFFPEYKMPAESQAAYNYFRARAQQTWTQQSKYLQGMLVLVLSRNNDQITPSAILRSLKETSITNEELGMYWKDANRGWWWYEAPIERQALLIEAFQEVGKDTKTVNDLRTWLLKNKQSNSWESTKATAEACYALLIQGTQWLGNDPTVSIRLGNTVITSADNNQEEGTGYFKRSIEGDRINPEMGNIYVTMGPPSQGSSSGSGVASWGCIYWQYFEDLDKITGASTPLQLVKKLFVEKNTDRGPVLVSVNDGDDLKVGDKLIVRIELRVDRDMEYVHMKDMRAAATEPLNVLSSYKWQGGLGYYESTKDASTNFFFSSLRKGTYVFEYPLFVTHTGNFSNGVTTIQCMYAPEFASHSEGLRINVE